MHKHRPSCWLALACSSILAAETTSHAPAVAQMIVTSDCYDHDPPALTADDVIIADGYKSMPIAALVPLRGARAELEIYVLVDNSSNWDLGDRFVDLRKFLDAQPPTTSIGVAYIQDGRLEVAQRPTHDRERALLALSSPSGGSPSNPFRPLAELIEGWHQDSSRHVVLMISNGIDVGGGVTNASVETALQVAQHAGVVVYSIYHPGADYLTLDFTTVHSGQVQLAHLVTETGGDGYFQGLGPLPSFAPSLANIGEHLANQYLLEFEPNPEIRGALHDVSLTSKRQDVHLTGQWRVWVPHPPALKSDASVKKTVVAGHKGERRALRGDVGLLIAR